MNIFKALSEGNGKISETNITSFLSYLLDSSNELNNVFFMLFIKLIDKHLKSRKIVEILNLRNINLRDQIFDFTNNYTVISEPEYVIFNKAGKKQIPDILLKIIEKNNENDILYILIENKINKSSLTIGQIEKQLEFFKQSSDFNKEIPVISLLITPNDNIFKKMINFEFTGKTLNTVWLHWTNYETNNSIESTLKALIKAELSAEIEPIDPNTLFIIKSFIDYLATEFSKKEIGSKNFSFKGFDEKGKILVNIGNEKYWIKRFSNNMIRLFDKDENLVEIEVKPILRKVIESYDLNISLFHSTDIAKNTQILGREIINKLNITKPA